MQLCLKQLVGKLQHHAADLTHQEVYIKFWLQLVLAAHSESPMPIIRSQPHTPAYQPDGLKSKLMQSVLSNTANLPRQLNQAAANLTDVVLQSTQSFQMGVRL